MILPERRPLSLTTRVMVFVALAIGVSLLLIGSLVLSTVERHFAEQDAEELTVINSAIFEAIQSAEELYQQQNTLSNAVSGHHGVYFEVWGDDGTQPIFNTPDVDFSEIISTLPPVNPIQAEGLSTWKRNGKTYRGVVTSLISNGKEYRVVTGIDMSFHIQFLSGFRRSLWLIMLFTGGITLLATWLGVHQGHAPLRGLSENMRKIQVDRLHVRLNINTLPLELQDLATAFNQMMERLEESFARLSHFSADIAHELRTPLTNLITQTQVVLGKARTLNEYRELLYSNLEEQERLAKMVNDMLWLAKSDHGFLKPTLVNLDLAGEIEDLFEFFEALADEKNISLSLEGQASSIHCDRSMIRRAISNLLSNAIRHTPEGQWIKIRLDTPTKGEVSLSVINPASPISTEHLPRVFDRFYRADPSRTRQSEGVGLGLAIVRSIVDAHRGYVEAVSNQNTTTFTLFLPKSK